MDMLKIIGVGRLTRDAEMKYTTNQKAVTKFSIAVNRFKKDEVDFFECQAWGKVAESISIYLKKGTRIGIEGRPQVENWTTPEGQKRSRVVINCEQIQLLSPKPQEAAGQPEPDNGFYQADNDSAF